MTRRAAAMMAGSSGTGWAAAAASSLRLGVMQAAPLYLGEVGGFGVDEDGDVRLVRGGDDLGGDAVGEGTLAVIGEDDGADAGEPGSGGGEEGGFFGGVDGGLAFLVGADDLLVGGDEAGLAGGGAGGGVDDGGGDAGAGGEAADGVAGGVEADEAGEDGGAAEGGDVAGDVAGAAEHFAGLAEAEDGDGGFGGDALHVAIGEAVEHDVADAEDGDVGEVHWGGLPFRVVKPGGALGCSVAQVGWGEHACLGGGSVSA